MADAFFERPILNSPYEAPSRHWELDEQGQRTQRIIDIRRRAEFISPIPKPKRRVSPADQQQMVLDEGKGLSSKEQQYEHTVIINGVRREVDLWRGLRNPNDWKVTPETT